MAKAVLILAIVAFCALHVQSQNKTDFKGTLEARGFKLAAALFDIANMTNALNKPAAVYTVLVPNDNAVQAFLKRMNLTLDQLKARPSLAKQLAAQHIILKHNVRAAELFENGPVRIVKTLAGHPNDLLFRKVGNDVKVTDVQGFTANVKPHIAIDDNKTLHPIDKVMMPDSVFFDLKSLCEFRTLTLKDFCRTLVYANLNATLSPANLEVTVFVPNNKAFIKGLELNGGVVPTPARAADLLKYHVLPGGARTVGSSNVFRNSIKDGAPQPTMLANQTLSVKYTAQKAAGSRKLPFATAEVLTSTGQRVPIVKANVHVGQMIVHGIESILLPGNTTSAATTTTAAATGPTASATTAAAPAGGNATKTGRHLLLSTEVLAAVDDSAAAGRALLGWGWGFSGGPTAEMDAAQGAIEAAADGDESTAQAAQQSLYGAETLSVPGSYNLVNEGVLPW